MAGMQSVLGSDLAGGPSSATALRTALAVGRKLDARDPAVARQAAGQFLSELFFKPILSEMRRFPIGRELATGGYTESVFGEQLDQRLADGVALTEPGLTEAVRQYFDAPRTRPRLEVYA